MAYQFPSYHKKCVKSANCFRDRQEYSSLYTISSHSTTSIQSGEMTTQITKYDHYQNKSCSRGQPNCHPMRSKYATDKQPMYVHQYNKMQKYQSDELHQKAYSHGFQHYYNDRAQYMKSKFDNLSLHPTCHLKQYCNKPCCQAHANKPVCRTSVKGAPVNHAVINKLEESYWAKWKPSKFECIKKRACYNNCDYESMYNHVPEESPPDYPDRVEFISEPKLLDESQSSEIDVIHEEKDKNKELLYNKVVQEYKEEYQHSQEEVDETTDHEIDENEEENKQNLLQDTKKDQRQDLEVEEHDVQEYNIEDTNAHEYETEDYRAEEYKAEEYKAEEYRAEEYRAEEYRAEDFNAQDNEAQQYEMSEYGNDSQHVHYEPDYQYASEYEDEQFQTLYQDMYHEYENEFLHRVDQQISDRNLVMSEEESVYVPVSMSAKSETYNKTKVESNSTPQPESYYTAKQESINSSKSGRPNTKPESIRSAKSGSYYSSRPESSKNAKSESYYTQKPESSNSSKSETHYSPQSESHYSPTPESHYSPKPETSNSPKSESHYGPAPESSNTPKSEPHYSRRPESSNSRKPESSNGPKTESRNGPKTESRNGPKPESELYYGPQPEPSNTPTSELYYSPKPDSSNRPKPESSRSPKSESHYSPQPEPRKSKSKKPGPKSDSRSESHSHRQDSKTNPKLVSYSNSKLESIDQQQRELSQLENTFSGELTPHLSTTTEYSEPEIIVLKHTDSFIINSRKQKRGRQHHQQPKFIRLSKTSSISPAVKGHTYPLKSALKKEKAQHPKTVSGFGRTSSPIVIHGSSMSMPKYLSRR